MVGLGSSVGPGALGPGSSGVDLRLTVAGVSTDLYLVRDPKPPHLPINWNRGTAPVVTPSINTSGELNDQSVPPDQGLEVTIGDVSGGAGSQMAQAGRYAFGRKVNTADGRVEPGPAVTAMTLTSGGALDGPIKAVTRHHDYTYFVAGQKVYKVNYDAATVTKTATDPTTTQVATDIISFAGLLLVAFDNGVDWAASGDDGATWQSAAAFGVPAAVQEGKHWAKRQQFSDTPVLVMVQDPNLLWYAEEPTNPASWSATGIKVGDPDGANADHFTSVATAPDGRLVVGKETGWYQVDEADNVTPMLGPGIRADASIGLENFAWPQQLGADLWTQMTDFDLVRLNPAYPETGYGPYRAGPDVEEMQRGIKAMASDGTEWLYVALSGSEGDVMRARWQGSRWVYHGGYVAIGEAIFNRMWLSSDPLATDKNTYLYITPVASPYLPYRALIPGGSADTDARYSASHATQPWIRYGFQTGGREQVTKLLLSTLPLTRNLSDGGAEVTLAYRTEYGASFTTGNTFDESPYPADMTEAEYATTVSGNVWETKATLFGSSNTAKPTIDTITTRALWRYPEDQLARRVDIIRCTVTGEQAIGGTMGGRSLQATLGLYNILRNTMGTVPISTLTRVSDAATWGVDLLSVNERYLKEGEGLASGMVYDLVFQELPRILTASSGGGADVPGVDVQVFVCEGGLTQTWTKPSGTPMAVFVQLWGAGGGGGGGEGQAVATNRAGGGGGGGGCYVEVWLDPDALGASETVTIGDHGSGGSGGSTAAGSVGTVGGNSSFGSWKTAFGGGPGAGGSGATFGGGGGGPAAVGASSGAGGGPGGATATGTANSGFSGAAGSNTSVDGGAANYGGAGGGGHASAAAGQDGGGATRGGPGGGSGGIVSNANPGAEGAGGAGGTINGLSAGGGALGAAHTAGGNGTSRTASLLAGDGGGGGGGTNNGTGAAGGNGGAPAGGGGGGGGGTSVGGAGGLGGCGYVVVTTFF